MRGPVLLGILTLCSLAAPVRAGDGADGQWQKTGAVMKDGAMMTVSGGRPRLAVTPVRQSSTAVRSKAPQRTRLMRLRATVLASPSELDRATDVIRENIERVGGKGTVDSLQTWRDRAYNRRHRGSPTRQRTFQVTVENSTYLPAGQQEGSRAMDEAAETLNLPSQFSRRQELLMRADEALFLVDFHARATFSSVWDRVHRTFSRAIDSER